jgi:hypothetical protein
VTTATTFRYSFYGLSSLIGVLVVLLENVIIGGIGDYIRDEKLRGRIVVLALIFVGGAK